MEQQPKYPIGGFAPGYYYCKCCDCGQQFFGDKRAVQCEPCAIKGKEAFEALSPEEQAEMVKRNSEEARNLFIRNHTSAPAVNWDQVKINFDAGMPELEASFQAGYSAGVDMAMKRAVSAPAVDEELRNLRQWKESAMELLRPIDQYTDKHPDIKLGKSKVEFVIDQARKFDQVSENATEVYELRVSLYRLLKAFKVSDKTDLQRKRYDEAEYILNKNFDIKDVLRDETGSQRQAGPGWVSSKQRLPEITRQPKLFIVKWFDDRMYVRTMTAGQLNDLIKVSVLEYFWLDESTPSKEGDAVEFIAWAYDNGYWLHSKNQWVKGGIKNVYTTEQLYPIYQKNK
jgi:hypothetical protein